MRLGSCRPRWLLAGYVIAFAVHDAYAASLVEEAPVGTVATEGGLPVLGDVLIA